MAIFGGPTTATLIKSGAAMGIGVAGGAVAVGLVVEGLSMLGRAAVKAHREKKAAKKAEKDAAEKKARRAASRKKK